MTVSSALPFRVRGLALSMACVLAAAGCSGAVDTRPIPTTASGEKICAMLSRADVATVFGTDDFTVEDPAVPLDRESNGELTGGGCVVDGDGFRLTLALGLERADAREEAEKHFRSAGFAELPGLRRFSADEGAGGVYRDATAETNVTGVLLRGDYLIEMSSLTGVPEERDRLADARALILQAVNSLGIPLAVGAPRPTPTP